MKPTLPLFREGIEWRKLTKAERGGKPWKYVLLTDVLFEVETGLLDRFDCVSHDATYMVLSPNGITMKQGYAWNGNSFSPDSIFGVCLRLPSLPHDGLFQFSGAFGFPRIKITLPWANWLYLKTAHPFWGKAYYAGLVTGSWALWAREPQNGEYVECNPILT